MYHVARLTSEATVVHRHSTHIWFLCMLTGLGWSEVNNTIDTLLLVSTFQDLYKLRWLQNDTTQPDRNQVSISCCQSGTSDVIFASLNTSVKSYWIIGVRCPVAAICINAALLRLSSAPCFIRYNWIILKMFRQQSSFLIVPTAILIWLYVI